MTNPEQSDKYNPDRPPRGLGEKVLAFFHLPYVPPIATINKKDYEAAQRDPAVIEFVNQAKETYQRMDEEGRLHR